jgi:hypothetical protein
MGVNAVGPRPVIAPTTSTTAEPVAPTHVSDAPHDAYGGSSPQPSSAQLTGEAMAPAGQLTSQVATLLTAEAVVTQFVLDFAVQQSALFGAPTLRPEQKAARTLEFLSPYAEQLAGLEVPPELRQHAASSLSVPVLQVGVLDHVVVEGSDRTAKELLAEMVRAESPAAVREASAQKLAMDASTPPMVAVAPNLTPSRTQATPEEEAAQRRRAGKSGVWAWVSDVVAARKGANRGLDEGNDKLLVAAGIAVIAFSFVVVVLITLLS